VAADLGKYLHTRRAAPDHWGLRRNGTKTIHKPLACRLLDHVASLAVASGTENSKA
jgi:hypothetical protein